MTPIKYSNNNIPCPYVDFTISNADQSQKIDLTGIVDTGADYTVIPHKVIAKLNVRIKESMPASDFKGEVSECPICQVNIKIQSMLYDEITVFVAGNDSLIGRNIINYWHLKLNGPQKTGYFTTV